MSKIWRGLLSVLSLKHIILNFLLIIRIGLATIIFFFSYKFITININNFIHKRAVYFFQGETIQDDIKRIEKPIGKRYLILRQLSAASILMIFLYQLFCPFNRFIPLRILFLHPGFYQTYYALYREILS